MKSILERLHHPNIEIVVFSESMILNDPIEDWPICDCLIAFFSVGFPLDKAVKYAKLRKPMLINDLESQYDLLDRCALCVRACVRVCMCVRVCVWVHAINLPVEHNCLIVDSTSCCTLPYNGAGAKAGGGGEEGNAGLPGVSTCMTFNESSTSTFDYMVIGGICTSHAYIYTAVHLYTHCMFYSFSVNEDCIIMQSVPPDSISW